MKKSKLKKAIEYILLAIYFFGSVTMEVFAKNTSSNCSLVMKYIDKYWEWVLLLAPAVLIVLGALDFVKATANGDNDAVKKATTSFIRRCIAVALLFLLKPLVRMVFTIFGLETHSCI